MLIKIQTPKPKIQFVLSHSLIIINQTKNNYRELSYTRICLQQFKIIISEISCLIKNMFT